MTITNMGVARFRADLFRDARLVELVAITADGCRPVLSGRFDDPLKFSAAIRSLPGAVNWYTTLNRPAATFAASNRLAPGSRFKAADFERRVRVFNDFDAPRAIGHNATSEEVAVAKQQAREFATVLAGLGWPRPVIAESGNGVHLLYRAWLPNDDQVGQMLRQLYTNAGERFSTFDTVVNDAGRLCRVYGTLNVKNPATDDRPNRMSVVQIPHCVMQPVTLAHVKAALRHFHLEPRKLPRRPPNGSAVNSESGDYRSLDVVGWMQAADLYVGRVHGDMHEIRCPWAAEHSSRSRRETTVWEASGNRWPSFKCMHAHCAERRIRDLITAVPGADRFCMRPFLRSQP